MGGLRPPRPLAVADDREGFDCGRDSLNQWFRRHAWRNQEAGTSRTSVICDAESGGVAAYLSLAAGQVERAYLPKPGQRNRPVAIPVILLGQLAVDRRYQGRGCAGSLMGYAFGVAVRFSREIGCLGVVTHPLDDAVRDLYRRFGFEALPFDPSRSMFVRIVDLELNGF
jgi:GNAT superfamily N-acetyltransferase